MAKSRKLIVLVVIAISVRLIYGHVYSYRGVPDTTDFFNTAEQFVTGNYSEYTGLRMLGYPLLIAATGANKPLIIFIQVIFGVGIAMLLYLLFSTLSKSQRVGFVCGLAYALNPTQIFFEFMLMSETTATFLLVLSGYFLFKEKYTAAGCTCMLLILTRPQFVALLIPLGALMIYRNKLRANILFAPIVIGLIAWMFFQENKIGQFTLTTNFGLGLTQHTVKFIEHAPEEYDEIKRVLIGNRDKKSPVAASLPTLMEKTGMTFPELTACMATMSLETVIEVPFKYLRSVVEAFIRFFRPAWYGRLMGIRTAVKQGGWLLSNVAIIYALVHVLVMFAFLFLPFYTSQSSLVFIYILVMVIAVSQAFVASSENARYSISVDPLMSSAVVWAIADRIKKRSNK